MKNLFKKSLLVLMVAFIAVFTLGVANKIKAASYEETDFGEGKILITTKFDGSTYYLPATTTSSGPLAKSFSDVSEIGEEHLWTVTKTGDNYYIQNNEGKYLYTTSTNNGVRVGDTQNAWVYNATDNSFKDTATSRYLGIYNASNWRCYTTVNQSNYKESSTSFVFYTVNSAAPSVSISGDKYTEIYDDVTLTANTANVTGTVAWSSSNTAVATVDQSGNVTAKSFGKTTITAAVDDVEAELEFIVYPTDGSTLSVAEAIQVCEYTGTINCAFTYSVTGVIEKIDTAYDSGYNNITVTVNDGTGSIKAYRMTGGSDLVAGDNITVTGTLVNYEGNTPEFIALCTYVKNVNESVDQIRDALNLVNPYVSCAYKYIRTSKEVAAVSSATAQYTGETTGNMTASSNNAASLGLDEKLFEVTTAKNEASNEVGLNKDGTIRLYANASTQQGTSLTISSAQKIVSIEVVFGSTCGDITVNGIAQEAGASTTKTYAVNDTNVTIQNVTSTNVQVWIQSITINLEASGSTLVDEYSEVDFRFKLGVDSAIANLEGVTAHGICVSDGVEDRYYDSTKYIIDEENGISYVVISLGDIINDSNRASVEFTVCAYVVVNGTTYTSTASKSYSACSIIEYYLGLGYAVEGLDAIINK